MMEETTIQQAMMKGLRDTKEVRLLCLEHRVKKLDALGFVHGSNNIPVGSSSFNLLFAGGYHPVKEGELYKQGQYVVLHKLGWGHFSTVWLVEDVSTGQRYAMKVGRYCWRGPEGLSAALSRVLSFTPWN